MISKCDTLNSDAIYLGSNIAFTVTVAVSQGRTHTRRQTCTGVSYKMNQMANAITCCVRRVLSRPTKQLNRLFLRTYLHTREVVRIVNRSSMLADESEPDEDLLRAYTRYNFMFNIYVARGNFNNFGKTI